jgi:hypothetical protein
MFHPYRTAIGFQLLAVSLRPQADCERVGAPVESQFLSDYFGATEVAPFPFDWRAGLGSVGCAQKMHVAEDPQLLAGFERKAASKRFAWEISSSEKSFIGRLLLRSS